MVWPSLSLRASGIIQAVLIISIFISSVILSTADQAEEFLEPQNAIRRRKGVPPLVWDGALAQVAYDYGMTRSDCSFVHSDGPYGENLFSGSGRDWQPKDAVDAWNEEEKYYDVGSNSCAEGQMCGHYTQAVWRSTKRVGCAVLPCNGDKDTFIICNYDPPGNYDNEGPFDRAK